MNGSSWFLRLRFPLTVFSLLHPLLPFESCFFVPVSCFMRLTFLAERLCIRVERAEQPQELLMLHAEFNPALAQRESIRRFFRAKAPVATAMIRRTKSPPSCLGHRTEARRSVGKQRLSV